MTQRWALSLVNVLRNVSLNSSHWYEKFKLQNNICISDAECVLNENRVPLAVETVNEDAFR